MRYCTNLYRFNLGANSGSEATQLMSQVLPSLASTLSVIRYHFGGVRLSRSPKDEARRIYQA